MAAMPPPVPGKENICPPARRRRYLLTAAAVSIAVGIIAVYGAFEPAGTMFPRCMMVQLTGLSCPGCGAQRALHALLNGHPLEAWSYNLLLPAETLYMMALCVAACMRDRLPRLHARLNSRAAILTALVAIVVWTIVRNIFHI